MDSRQSAVVTPNVILRVVTIACIMLPIVFATTKRTALAHEVQIAVVDMTIADGTIDLSIKLNLEAFVAKIDLENLKDTDETENSADYDRLRALEPAEMEAAFRTFWPEMRESLNIESQGRKIAAQLVSVTVPAVGNVDLPRASTIVLSAAGGEPVRVGWARRYGSLILRQHGLPDEQAFTGILAGGELSPPITARGATRDGAWATFLSYIGIGFDHIVPKGLDHILFILGLFFLSPRFRTLLWQVTAFTLAHTVTLALGALDVVSVSPQIVEPLIAASIVFVAVENIFTDGLSRWRPALIFGFGLLHGLGFASVLGDFGLPDDQFIPALIGFNVGVEVGQLAVIAVAFLLVGIWFRNRPWYRKVISIPASCAIALVGVYWIFERTMG